MHPGHYSLERSSPINWSDAHQKAIFAVRFLCVAYCLVVVKYSLQDRLDALWTAVLWGVPVILLLGGYASRRWIVSIRRIMALGLYIPLGGIWAYLTCVKSQVSGGPFGIVHTSIFFTLYALAMDCLLVLGAEARAVAATRRWVPKALLALIMVPVCTSLATAFAFRSQAEQEPTRIALAMDVHRELSLTYPHWKESTIDSDDLWRKYRPRLGTADKNCGQGSEPCRPFLRALRDMLAELRNGHSYVTIEGDIGAPRVVVEHIEGRAVVTGVGKASEAERAHIVPGMEILSVDGLSVQDALERVPAWQLNDAAIHTRAYSAYMALLTGVPNTRVSIEIMDVDRRTVRTFILSRKPLHDSLGTSIGLDSRAYLKSLDGGMQLLVLRGFEGDGLPAKLDRFINRVMKGQGLVLDLRDNPGGRVDTALHLLGRLLNPMIIGEDCSTQMAGILDFLCENTLVEPVGIPYTGPIAVMIDEGTASAAEVVALSICRTGRGRCFGRTTAGETDTVIDREIPGGRVFIANADFHPAFGGSIQGSGLQPDVPIAWSLQDVVDRRDPDLDAALTWLGGQVVQLR